MYTPLVRKYAIRCFDNVIGQPIVVKILKNSLFLNHIFSVYLFAGKHGCGKTSTARLFATALNCERLPLFQKNPHEKIPCQTCQSCLAMQLMQHPDFIEIDAASHTGVDNVRLLIDSAALLPLVGKKKIYLIDEAHMLSKAACNAFLKILEEPPKDVLFILATTAPEKILETVRSRCFQLFFDPIHEATLIDLLSSIADNEQIVHTRDGIARIVGMSKGSVRDALNMLDQTRLAVTKITIETLKEVFGSSSDDDIIELFNHLFFKQTTAQTILLFQKIFPQDQHAFTVFFDRIVYCARGLLWFLYGQEVSDSSALSKFDHFKVVKPNAVIQFLSHLYHHEIALKRSENPALFFEVILLLFLEKNNIQGEYSSSGGAPAKKHTESLDLKGAESKAVHREEESLKGENHLEVVVQSQQVSWVDFLQQIMAKNDPLLLSIFKQGVFQSFDQTKKIVTVQYQKDRSFFSDILTENKKDWLPLFHNIFGINATLNTTFTADIVKELPITKNVQEQALPVKQQAISSQAGITKEIPQQQEKRATYKSFTTYQYSSKNLSKPAKIVDIADQQKWQYAHLVQRVFPGIVTEFEKGDT